MKTEELSEPNTSETNRIFRTEFPRMLIFSFVVIVSNGWKTLRRCSVRAVEVNDEHPYFNNLVDAINEAIDDALKSLPNSHVVSFSHTKLN